MTIEHLQIIFSHLFSHCRWSGHSPLTPRFLRYTQQISSQFIWNRSSFIYFHPFYFLSWLCDIFFELYCVHSVGIKGNYEFRSTREYNVWKVLWMIDASKLESGWSDKDCKGWNVPGCKFWTVTKVEWLERINPSSKRSFYVITLKKWNDPKDHTCWELIRLRGA